MYMNMLGEERCNRMNNFKCVLVLSLDRRLDAGDT
jgi:hypothetical protein